MMTATRLVRLAPVIAFVGAIALVATGRATLDMRLFVAVAGVVVVAGIAQRRLEASARVAREERLAEVAAAHGLQPVAPPPALSVISSLRRMTQGDLSVAFLDPERDSPSWELWRTVLPSGSTECRFLAVGDRDGRPLRLSVERSTTTETNGSGNRRTKVTRSVAVATRVPTEGTLEIRPAGRAWQAIGDAVGRVFRQQSHRVGVAAFDDKYSVIGDEEAVQALLDPATAAWWPDGVGDATVAVAHGWLAAARPVPLDAEETAATAERLLPAVDALAERLIRR